MGLNQHIMHVKSTLPLSPAPAPHTTSSTVASLSSIIIPRAGCCTASRESLSTLCFLSIVSAQKSLKMRKSGKSLPKSRENPLTSSIFLNSPRDPPLPPPQKISMFRNARPQPGCIRTTGGHLFKTKISYCRAVAKSFSLAWTRSAVDVSTAKRKTNRKTKMTSILVLTHRIRTSIFQYVFSIKQYFLKIDIYYTRTTNQRNWKIEWCQNVLK